MDAIKRLGRMPKRSQGTSEQARAENKLAKRSSDHKGSLPDDILQELRSLGGAPQPDAQQAIVDHKGSLPDDILQELRPLR